MAVNLYSDITRMRFLPVSFLTIDYVTAEGIQTAKWGLLEEDSSCHLGGIIRPEDVGSKLMRTVAYEIDIKAISPVNDYDGMLADLVGITTCPISQVQLGLYAQPEQVAGGQTLIALHSDKAEVYDWRIAWSIDSADMRPRLTISVSGIFSVDAIAVAGDDGGFFQQLGGW